MLFFFFFSTGTRIKQFFQHSTSRKAHYIKMKTSVFDIFDIFKKWSYSFHTWVFSLFNCFLNHIKQREYWLMCGSFVYTFPQGKLCFSLLCTNVFICQKPRKDDFGDLASEWVAYFSLVWTLAKGMNLFSAYISGRFLTRLVLEFHCKGRKQTIIVMVASY